MAFGQLSFIVYIDSWKRKRMSIMPIYDFRIFKSIDSNLSYDERLGHSKF